MTFQELQQSTSVFKLGVLIERFLPLPKRLRLARSLGFLVVIFLCGALLFSIFTASPSFAERLSVSSGLLALLQFVPGLFYIALALYLALFSVNACYYSSACRGFPLLLREPFWKREPLLISFDAAVSVSEISGADIFRSFSKSFLGKQIFLRLGISSAAVRAFVNKPRHSLTSDSLSVSARNGAPISLSDIVMAIFSVDQDAALFLAEQSVSAGVAAEAAGWVERCLVNMRRGARALGRERLGRIQGIGKDWAYGSAWRLSRYGKDIAQIPAFARVSSAEALLAAGAGEQAEAVLSRVREANALLVGDAGSPREAAIAFVLSRIRDGSVLPQLEHKRLILFDTNSFIAETKTKIAFESELLRLFKEIESAGNLIVVLPDFPAFLESAATLGSDAGRLLDEFLASTRIQLIALAETGAFHRTIEPNAELMKRFERILVPAPDERAVLPYLEDEAVRIEAGSKLFFTFPAVEAAVKASARYFMGESLLDKAVDVLYEAASAVKKAKRIAVLPSDVLSVVEKRTGVPVGALKESERATLLTLESALRARVVGQDEALATVAAALRRARSGIANPNRPFGSFLFLGPTGVGKTETAKALASSFFGSEDATHRLDLSEYQTADALERLIGSFTAGKPGVLASLLREKPYGVLLLDEFEKTTVEIRHLFLQVLDEGFFTDAAGKRVNCRNLLIIATSNAGSDLIWNAVRQGNDLSDEKKRITDALVERGSFTPELLNRFDGVVLFQPLTGKNLRAVAVLMLQKLAKRLSERGVMFVPTQRLVDFVAEAGADPQFGARAMQRAINDSVERAIADKILRGEIRPGSRVELSPEELHS
ncbi:MAG: Clp protease ATP binding subunit [Parcubacteria group bacterium Gr01-1014_17]|nr:MAG: Clp protease ATP binding subunit [Parcubacteria group bacterium Gr01-1014_17]